MAPEQARGQVDQIDATTDVYALGAVLYELLSGHPPYEGDRARDVLVKVLAGPPPPPGEAHSALDTIGFEHEAEASPQGSTLPKDLVDSCNRAMSRHQDYRHADGRELAAEMAAWLDGAKRRERALAVVGRARELLPEVASLRQRAEAQRERAAALLEGIHTWDPEDLKAPAWALEDRATAADRQAELLDIRYVQQLHGALSHQPDLPEAHAALVDRYQAEHVGAETRCTTSTRPPGRSCCCARTWRGSQMGTLGARGSPHT